MPGEQCKHAKLEQKQPAATLSTSQSIGTHALYAEFFMN